MPPDGAASGAGKPGTTIFNAVPAATPSTRAPLAATVVAPRQRIPRKKIVAIDGAKKAAMSWR